MRRTTRRLKPSASVSASALARLMRKSPLSLALAPSLLLVSFTRKSPPSPDSRATVGAPFLPFLEKTLIALDELAEYPHHYVRNCCVNTLNGEVSLPASLAGLLLAREHMTILLLASASRVGTCASSAENTTLNSNRCFLRTRCSPYLSRMMPSQHHAARCRDHHVDAPDLPEPEVCATRRRGRAAQELQGCARQGLRCCRIPRRLV
mgnify:CR=1 FL=1